MPVRNYRDHIPILQPHSSSWFWNFQRRVSLLFSNFFFFAYMLRFCGIFEIGAKIFDCPSKQTIFEEMPNPEKNRVFSHFRFVFGIPCGCYNSLDNYLPFTFYSFFGGICHLPRKRIQRANRAWRIIYVEIYWNNFSLSTTTSHSVISESWLQSTALHAFVTYSTGGDVNWTIITHMHVSYATGPTGGPLSFLLFLLCFLMLDSDITMHFFLSSDLIQLFMCDSVIVCGRMNAFHVQVHIVNRKYWIGKTS